MKSVFIELFREVNTYFERNKLSRLFFWPRAVKRALATRSWRPKDLQISFKSRPDLSDAGKNSSHHLFKVQRVGLRASALCWRSPLQAVASEKICRFILLQTGPVQYRQEQLVSSFWGAPASRPAGLPRYSNGAHSRPWRPPNPAAAGTIYEAMHFIHKRV